MVYSAYYDKIENDVNICTRIKSDRNVDDAVHNSYMLSAPNTDMT